jgi:hypothetical protein
MLITFKSKAAAEIIMYAEHAKPLLDIIGKTLEPAAQPRGIITAEQVPAALAKLKAAADQTLAAVRSECKPFDDAEPSPGEPISVSLAQRAYPLIDMLERAQKMEREITWGA